MTTLNTTFPLVGLHYSDEALNEAKVEKKINY